MPIAIGIAIKEKFAFTNKKINLSQKRNLFMSTHLLNNKYDINI